MKQCPECSRTYADDTLNYCLDDGASLVYGPAEPATAILTPDRLANEDPTRIFAPSATPENDSPPETARPTTSKRNSIIAAVFGIILVTALAVGSYIYYGRGVSKQIESIAVMPFSNESGNADIEYLSDGLTETLINSLTELPNLNVKPRSSAFRFKDRETDAKTIGRELNVGAILNGRLVTRGDEFTLFLILVDTGSENQIWGKQYTRKLANLVALQNEIVRDVSDSLRTKLTETDVRAGKNQTANPEAYRLYLQGRFHWNKRTRGDIERAVEYFQQSTALDPQFALAYSGLADSLSMLSNYKGTPAHQSMAAARSAAQTALSLDPDLAEAHTALGNILFGYDHDFTGAEREYKRAAELNPEYAPAHQMYGLMLGCLGRHDEALAGYRRALDIEPVSLPINRGYGIALIYARKYDESARQFRKTIELDPAFPLAHFGLAQALTLQQKYPESADAYAKGLEVGGSPAEAARLREAFATGGWIGYLRTRLQLRQVGPTPQPHYVRAASFVHLGDKASAIAALNKSFEDREGLFTALNVEPTFDLLRGEPGFMELVRKLGLPENR